MSWNDQLNKRIIRCRLCPRLVPYLERVGKEKKREFCDWEYWAKPVPSFGDSNAQLLVIGLAPAAHGGNRTGRVFTGDSSGDFLFAALYRAGFANQAFSVSRGDGLALHDAWIAAAVRCAPPDNRPTPVEFETCRNFLAREIAPLGHLPVVPPLGALAWRSALEALARNGVAAPRATPKFAHGAEVDLGRVILLGSYHVSQQNTL